MIQVPLLRTIFLKFVVGTKSFRLSSVKVEVGVFLTPAWGNFRVSLRGTKSAKARC